MRNGLSTFDAELGSLAQYIRGLELERQLLAQQLPPQSDQDGNIVRLLREAQSLASQPGARRRFEYNGVIISMYGLLEQYVEALIRGYVVALNDLTPTYAELPEHIRSNHVPLSFNLLAKLDQSRYRGVVTEEQVVANLHSCTSNSPQYRVNADAFARHTANFRTEVIDDALAKLGIHQASQRARAVPVLAAYLGGTPLPPAGDAAVATAGEPRALQWLNDLAERRNEVAHGTPVQLLGPELLLDGVAFLRAYGAALLEVVTTDLLPLLVRHRAVRLGQPITVIRNNIVCIRLRNAAVRLGDVLVAHTRNKAQPYLAGPITELQVDNMPLQEVASVPEIDAGVRVEFHAKRNQTFYLVSQSDFPA